MKANEIIDEIVKDISNIGKKHNFQMVFSDWVEMMAIAIQNSCTLHDDIWQARENKYLSIVKKYTKDEIIVILNMYSKLVNAFECEYRDYLGDIFMRLATNANKKIMGQCFTPFNISMAMAKLNLAKIEDKEISLYEPTCGAGGMIIGYARVLFEKGINFQNRLKVMAQDLDTLCVHMTYVQLSLIGINAVVAQGDSLEEKFDEIPENRKLRTPKNLYFF